MTPISNQVLSDLHLETHPSHDSFTIPQTAPYLALLGDIGHVAEPQLYNFLEAQLAKFSIVFFLLGNHEPYHVSFKLAKSKLNSFQSKMHKQRTVGRFVFLDQTRFDISPDGFFTRNKQITSTMPNIY